MFNIFAKDHGASRTFRNLGKAASSSSNDMFKLSKVTKTLGDAFDKLQSGGKIAAIGGAAIASVPHVLALSVALANVAPAAYAIVPAALAGGLALGTMKLAMSGVSDALGNLGSDSKSVKKFDEALKSLSPSARSFAVEMKRLYPTLVAVRKVVQETAFHGLSAQLKPLAANLLPTVRRGLVGVALAGNSAALQLAAFLRTGQAKSLLGTALAGIVTALKGMSGIPAKLGKSLLQIAVAAMPAFQRLTGVMVGFFTTFSNYVNRKSAGGQFTAMINGAIDTLSRLGRVAGNIGSAIGGIFKAAGNGAGILGSIERITKAIADAVNSKAGQEVLSKVFETMAKAGPIIAVAGALSFVIGALGGALAALAEPAGLIAVGLVAVGAGFVYLYRQSSGLREIVAGVGSKLRELWDLFAAKGLPIIKDFAFKGLGVLVAGFNGIRDTIRQNKPELQELWVGVKKVASFIMASWPAMSAVGIGALKGIFEGIQTGIRIIGAAVRWFNFFRDTVLNVFSAMINSAATTFGWIPGLGDKLRDAQKKFEDFAGKVTHGLDTIPDEVSVGVSTPGAKESEFSLKAIADAIMKIPGSKATNVSTPGSVNAKLELSKLKIGLDALRDKVIGLKTRGVPVTAGDLNSIKAKAEALERTYTVAVRVSGGTDAAASLNQVKAAAERMERAYTVTTYHNEVYSATNKPQMRASGGPVKAGQPYIVGENRPELFIPSQNGTIMPRVPAMAGGGGGGSPVFNVSINMPPGSDGADVVRKLQAWCQQNGALRLKGGVTTIR